MPSRTIGSVDRLSSLTSGQGYHGLEGWQLMAR